MGSNAIPAFGTLLKRGDGGAPETFTTVAEVQSLNGPEVTADTKDVTTHSSGAATPWEEVLPTLLRSGEVSMTLGFLPGTAGHKALLTDITGRVKRNWQMIFPDAGSTTWPFSAYVTKVGPQAEVDGVLQADVTIKLTGAITFP